MDYWEDHIIIEDSVMNGKPVIKGTRLTVDHILDLLKRRWTSKQIVDEYPGITGDDIAACAAYAAEVAEAERALEEAREEGSIPFDDVKKEFGD